MLHDIPSFENDHNVYVLGAGFSFHAGIPLIRNFMNRMRDAIPQLESAGRVEEADSIKRVLRFRLEASSASYRIKVDPENIEELFCLASARDSDGLSRDMTVAIAATIDVAAKLHKVPTEVLHVNIDEWKTPRHWSVKSGESQKHAKMFPYEVPSYDLAVGSMIGQFTQSSGSPSKSSIISFNYDTVVEQALDRIGAKFSYGFSPQSVVIRDSATCLRSSESVQPSVMLLKIHGSMNWGIEPGAQNKLNVFGQYSDLPAVKMPPLLVPPTWRKVFGGEMNAVWDAAIAALSNATRLIVIGFSMPPVDTHFKYLLAAGLQNNISLRQVSFVDTSIDLIRERAAQFVQPGFLNNQVVNFATEDAVRYLCNSGSSFGRALQQGRFLR